MNHIISNKHWQNPKLSTSRKIAIQSLKNTMWLLIDKTITVENFVKYKIVKQSIYIPFNSIYITQPANVSS